MTIHDTTLTPARQQNGQQILRFAEDDKKCAEDDKKDTLAIGFGESSLGLVLVARSATGVAAVLLGDDRDTLRRDLQTRFPLATLMDGGATMNELVAWVTDFVESSASDLDVPLDMRGTEFQRRVWQALREIPAGSTASYAEIAKRIGRPNSVRAVAQACAANALAVLVPCHRVVASDGALSGYRWGIERKQILLEREAAGRTKPPILQPLTRS